MIQSNQKNDQIKHVSYFNDLVSTPFQGEINAVGWSRKLIGDFSEIVDKVKLTENMVELAQDELLGFDLSEQGQLARDILLNDWKLLKEHGASPILNIIKCYQRDDDFPFFPTDVYSFHVDRSPIPTDTFLCTYFGAPSEILPNAQAIQKVLVPEIRKELLKLYDGPEAGFESFLNENFFDLHYQAISGAQPIGLGVGNMWRLAVDHPESLVMPCVHRAPKENHGQKRLLMIC